MHWYLLNFAKNSPDEAQTQAFLRKELSGVDVFYNIGANIGIYPIWMANLHNPKRIVAFEPEAANYECLMDNVRINNNMNTVCIPVAAWNSGGYERFYTEDEWAGNASGFLEGYATDDKSSRFSQVVHTARIDDVVSALELEAPDIILMDIDGGELKALQGMPRCLSSCRVVIVEVDEKTCDDVDNFLSENGFRLDVEKMNRRGNRIYRATFSDQNSSFH